MPYKYLYDLGHVQTIEIFILMNLHSHSFRICHNLVLHVYVHVLQTFCLHVFKWFLDMEVFKSQEVNIMPTNTRCLVRSRKKCLFMLLNWPNFFFVPTLTCIRPFYPLTKSLSRLCDDKAPSCSLMVNPVVNRSQSAADGDHKNSYL